MKPNNNHDYCFGQRYVTGKLILPSLQIEHGKPITEELIDQIQSSRTLSNEEARRILSLHKNSVSGALRAFDGPGSSLDLPIFQKLLSNTNSPSLKGPMTLTVASHFRLMIELEPARSPDHIEYVAPDFNIYPDDPMICSGEIDIASITNKQLHAPFYIFSNIFGLSGVRITLKESSPFVLAGGMESSNAFNMSLLIAATLLSGAQLTYGDLFSLAVKIENDEFDGVTGGQGHICFLSPYASSSLNIWTSGLSDQEGRPLPYGAFCIDKIPQASRDVLLDHVVLLQYGKEYQDGKPAVQRSSAVTNSMWEQLLRDHDRVGFPLHLEKLQHVIDYVTSLAERDYTKASEITHRYVEIRDQLVKRWLSLMLAARDPNLFSQLDDNEKEQSQCYFDCVFNPKNKDFSHFAPLRQLYDEYQERVTEVSPYSFASTDLIQSAWSNQIAIMPLGAGGPGASLFCISEKTSEEICYFLHDYDSRLHSFDDLESKEVLHDTGCIRGFFPLKLDRQGLLIQGFEGCQRIPAMSCMQYDQIKGVFSIASS